MKKVLLAFVFALTLFVVKPGFAGDVKPEVARMAAETFLSGNGAKSSQLVDISETAGFENLYVFTTESSFVLVAGDDRVQPILGYSLTEKFVTEGMPAHVRWWIQSYSDQIQYAKDNNLMATSDAGQAWASLTSGLLNRDGSEVVVEPLLSTKWDQGYPYNYYAPSCTSSWTGNHCYTGCVATAMGQMMKYWNWPESGNGEHSYSTSSYGGTLSVDFSAANYNWSIMPNTLGSTANSAAQAVALLLYHCGVAVNMDYSPSGSGAQSADVPDALQTYFSYASSARYISNDSYSSEEWIALLKSELDEGRPVYYCGRGDDGGHAFICDGYRSDNFFHFNWGWSGSYNNYYAIGALNTANGSFNQDNAAIIGVEPVYSLPAPSISASVSNGGIELVWEAVSGAVSYDVYRDNVKIATGVTETNYIDNDVVQGTTYQYYVRSIASNTKSNPSNMVFITYSSDPVETVLLYEPFEEYAVGDKIAVASNAAGHSWWTTWSNAPGGNEDGYIVEYGGEKCAHLIYGNDQVLLLGDEENGVYDLEFDILVPDGKNGYFNILHHFNGSGSTWALESYLHMTDGSTSAPGTGAVIAGGTAENFNAVYDAWMHFRLHVNTDTDVAEYYYTAPNESETLITTWQWSLNADGTSTIGGKLAAMDFFPPNSASTSEYYLDNLSCKKIGGDSAPTSYHIMATCNPVGSGTVTGAGVYTYNSTCALTATPNNGYVFVNWTENDSQVSTNAEYSFSVTDNRTLVANFEVSLSDCVMITNYDLQSNASLGNRIATWADGTAAIVATWDHSGSSSFPNRGAGYNFFDGSSFGSMPTERQEPMKSGWPSIATCGEGEVLASHASGVNVYYRPTKGEGDWTQLVNFPNMTWPRIVTSGSDEQYVHVVACYQESVGTDTYLNHLYYIRSTDRGQTWSDVMDVPLVDNSLEGDYRSRISADNYMLAANGDDVAILLGNKDTDLFYVISHDNGATWQKQIVAPFPIEGQHSINFQDYPEGMADTLFTCDYSHSIAIDDNGTVHVAFALLAWRPTSESGYSYWYAINHGIVYWNSEYVNEEGGHEIPLYGHWSEDACHPSWEPNGVAGSLSVERLALLAEADGSRHLHLTGYQVDEDGDGVWNATGFYDRLYTYKTKGCSTTPGISVDDQGSVAVVFNTVSETRKDSNGLPYRSAIVSLKDFNDYWYDNAINLSSSHVNDEAYPTFAASRAYNGTFWVGYSADEISGIYVSNSDHEITENRICAVNVDPSVLNGWGENTFEVTASTNPIGGGMITGRGVFHNGELCTLTVTPYEGYEFVNWSENSVSVSTNAEYSFNVTSNRTLVANFRCGVTASVAPTGAGTVIGTGIFDLGQTCTLTAVPNADYAFVNWTEDGVEVSADSIYSFAVSSRRVLVANFKSLKLEIAAYPNPAEGGTVSFNGLPTTLSYDFEDSSMGDWTMIDADGDGYCWELGSAPVSYMNSNHNLAGSGHNSSADFVLSGSYSHTHGALSPDNYLVSPLVSLGGSITFYACAQDASWADEHFGVAVSTTGNTNPADFNTIQEWTMTSGRSQGVWFEYTVDLSAYGGQTGYVAIRHFNCTDQFFLDIDDITLTMGGHYYTEGETCTLTATPNTDYYFLNWTKENEVVSTEPTYSFTVTEEASFVANFNHVPCEITAVASPAEGGTVTGAGTYDYQTLCTLTATPNANYTFLYWTKDGVTVSTDAEYSFAALENATYTAHFTRTLQPDSNNIVYVKPNGAGSNDGSSWANATGDLSKALEFWATQTTKPTIWVAAGTYYGDGDAANSAFTLVDGVSVYGGFAGNEPADYDLSLRDFTANATILDGQNVQRVLFQPNDFENSTTWSGFTIKNGYVYVENTSIVPAGAGAYLRNNTTLENSIITANSLQYLKHVAASNGGGIYIIGADAALTNCTITDNHIELIDSDSTSTYVCRGGGVYARNTTVDKCVIANNSSYYYGGGMYVYASNVSNCLIANNSAMYGGAIYGNGTSNNAIRNCDIVRNRAIEYAGGVYSASSAVLDFTNCIIWGNNTESQNYLNILVRPGTTYNYCAIEGGFDGDNNINLFTENDGNGLLYPRFVNPSPTAGNINAFGSYSWQLAEGSICINRGDLTNVSNGDLDLAGNPRIQQGGVDMGCYESSYQAAEVPVYADGIVYVKPSASGAMDGTSWDNAMDDINAALSMADLTNTPAVWVAAGTYYGDCIADHIAFTIVEGVDVYGGFAGNEPADYDLTQRDFTSHPTILDGKDERPVVTQNTVFNDTTIWDGLTIQHSISSGRGGGIWTEGGMVLSNLTIKNCSADDGGGGLYLKGSELNKSVIENCSAPVGGGIMCENSTVSNCIFRNNSAEYDGGAAYVWSGTFTDCLFTDNYNAGVYGTICADGRTSEGYEGGTFVNCDIVNNTAYGYSAIYNNDTGGTFKNCLIWGNTSNNGYSQINGSGTFTYCAIEGGYDGTGNINLASSNDGTDNLNYVRFMDAANGNYQLQLGSACIDAGDPDYLPNEALDLGGRARVHDGRVDIGCYEYHGIIETNFSDEICYGEDYVFNGFNIVRPDEGTAVHSITLPSAQGLDSIVNLTLTVNPVYFIEEDTIVCDVSSYTWHGHVYTISGVYYDSLQTVHGCDSVFQLTLELYNTPLGDFDNMLPSGGYTVTTLPVTFNWDAVAGASKYDLYVWDAENQMPSDPIVSNLSYGYYNVSSLPNNRSYKWLVVAKNPCYETASSIQDFTLEVEPSLGVNTTNINFGEVSMNGSVTRNLRVTGVVLEDTLSIQIAGADAAMFSYVKASGWDNYKGGILRITFHPTAPQYTYNAEITVSCGPLSKTTALTGAVSDIYTFTTYVPEDVYPMNTPVPVYGMLVDWEGHPVPDADVEIGVFVMGTKRTLLAVTDAAGEFSALFEPFPMESGYYTVNSGRPGNNSTAVHDVFNIPGMMVATTDNILCTVTQDEPKTDSILIRNKSNVPLTNIQVTTLSAPSGCTVTAMPFNLGGLQEGYLVYTVVGTERTYGTYYEQLRLQATSDEGAETVIPVWYYCEEAKGLLEPVPGTLTTTIIYGQNKVVDVMLINHGDTETGTLTLYPNEFIYWITPVGGDTMPSIAPHDTAYISMRFALGNDFDPDPFVYESYQYILSERGDDCGFLIYFTVVNDPLGSIIIDVTDDFTWNEVRTDGPHVANADVVVKGYHSLDLLGHGFTNSQGLFQLDGLEEGYYRVYISSDNHHNDYEGVINVHGGANETKSVFLQYLPVVYSWNVSSTGNANEYNYELDVDYDPYVPVPVITIEHSGIHDLEYGESANFDITVINHGLIGAYDTHLNFSESSEYVFVPLIDIIDTIPPQDTIVIPGVYYRTINQSMYSTDDCDVHITAISMYHTNGLETGRTLIQNRSLPFELGNYSVCQPAPNSLCSGIPSYNYQLDAPFSSYYVEDGDDGNSIVVVEQFKNPCVEALFDVMDACTLPTVPGSLMMTSLSGATTNIAQNGPFDTEQLLLGQLTSFAEEALSASNGGLWDVRDCLWNAYDGLDGCSSRGLVQTTIDDLRQSSLYYYNEFTFVKSIFANDAWNDEENVVAFVNTFKSLIDPVSGMVSNSDATDLALSFVGTSVGYDDIISFVERWNRSVDYWSNNYFMITDLPSGYNPDFIQIDNAMINSMVNIENSYSSLGAMGMREVFAGAVDDGRALKAQGSKLHSSVRMRLSQKSAMACETYDETFVIHNGHDTNPMTEIGLDFVVMDANGNDCTNLFQINTTLQQINGIDGSGFVDPGMDGTVKIECIPTRAAAQAGQMVYYCGGTFSFIDPYTSSPIIHELYRAPITITPAPDLYVDYFMPRYIIADDTATAKIERSEIAELGVIINNKGGRIAENVTLETAKPLVINYWDGIDNPYALKNVMFNGALRPLGLMEIPFGNIDMSQTSVGEWRFSTKTLGYFENYRANVIHNSSYGNSDLSLVSRIALHELVHPIYAYGNLDDGINDFLINGDYDVNGTPDSIYFSQGGVTTVDMVETISFDHYVEPNDTIVILTLNPLRVGWNYGVIDDPGRDKYELMSCTRIVDNQVIPLDNVWQSFVSFGDGAVGPIYENKLHIVDTLYDDAMDFTYSLVYCLRDDLLEVVEITGIPQNDIDYPLQSFTVKFNKSIVDTTFTYEDMTLTCGNSANLMDPSVVITMIDTLNYEVNISSLTDNPGSYVLTVNTSHIVDRDGYEGYNAKQATWTQTWTDYTQTDDLTAGWNWWSTYIDMSTAQDFDKLKNALGDNASMIKSRNDGFVSYYDGWYGSLTTLNNGEMYMINMKNDLTVSITGPLADVNTNVVDLSPGWNWIGYPLHGNQGVNAALANLTAVENDMIKSRNAFASYNPSLGWVGTLTDLVPGEGYMYNFKGSASTSFVYATPSKIVRHPKTKGTNHWEMSVGGYDMNATLIGVIEVNGEEQRDDMLVIGAFIDDRCVGQTHALYIDGLDRYLVFLTYYGYENDEITFRLYDENVGMEYGVSETTVLFAANSSLGTVEEPMAIEFNTMGIAESYAKSVTLFPNPVRSMEKVRITLNEGLTAGMEVEILSSLGVQLYKTIARGEVLELTAPTSPGVYFIKITSKEGYVSYGKMIVE